MAEREVLGSSNFFYEFRKETFDRFNDDFSLMIELQIEVGGLGCVTKSRSGEGFGNQTN